MRGFLLLLALGVLTFMVSGQTGPFEIWLKDPIKVCGKRFSLELENEQVRVIRARLSGKDNGVLSEFPGHLIVFLTGGHIRLEYEDLDNVEIKQKPGSIHWAEGGMLRLQNLGSRGFECLIVEQKCAISDAAGG